MLKPGQLRRIISFYLFLVLTNLGIFFYEVMVVEMSLEQSLVFRGATLITDIFESILFLESFKNLAVYILKLFHLKIRCGWLLGGIKLALIAPNIYLLKLFIVNSFLQVVDIGVEPVVVDKILLAYAISLATSFFWGAIWVLCLEKLSDSLHLLWRQISVAKSKGNN